MEKKDNKEKDPWWKKWVGEGEDEEALDTTDETEEDLTLDDWYGRGTNYVRKAKRDYDWDWSSGGSWSKGGGYSSYLIGDTVFQGKADLISKSFNMAKNLLTAMNLPNPWLLNYQAYSLSNAKSDKIVLKTDFFDRTDMEDSEKMDIFLGLAVHEGGHKIHTDEQLKGAYELKLHNMGNSSATISVKHSIADTLEDERMENGVIKDFPGYSSYLEGSKKYFFEKLFSEELYTNLEKEEEEQNEAEKLLNLFFRIVRYPTHIQKEDLKKYEKFIKAIKKAVVPLATNQNQVYEQADLVYEIIKEFYEQNNEKSKESLEDVLEEQIDSTQDKLNELEQLMKSLEKQLNKLDYDEEQEQEELENELVEKSKEQKELEDLISQLLQQQADGEGEGKGKPKGKASFDSQAMAMASEMRKFDKSTKLSKSLKRDGKTQREIAVSMGHAEYGEVKNTIFIKPAPSISMYDNSKSRIHKYASALKKLLTFETKDYKIALKSMKSGILDTNKIVEAVQGVATVYERFAQVKSNKICVCLLIDESGSMCGQMEPARDTAVLFNEVLMKNPDVDLYVYGHSADEGLTGSTGEGETVLRIYREKGYAPKGAIGATKARVENRDGQAIWEVAKRIRKFTDQPCVMFVIADGQPAAYNYYGPEAEKHTRDMVKKITKTLNFVPFQVRIGGFAGYGDHMFEHEIDISNVSQIPSKLGKVMKNVVRDMVKAEIKIL